MARSHHGTRLCDRGQCSCLCSCLCSCSCLCFGYFVTVRVRSVFEPFQLGNSSRLPATVQPFHLHHGTYRCNRALYDRVHGYARALDCEKCAWFRLVSVSFPSQDMIMCTSCSISTSWSAPSCPWSAVQLRACEDIFNAVVLRGSFFLYAPLVSVVVRVLIIVGMLGPGLPSLQFVAQPCQIGPQDDLNRRQGRFGQLTRGE